MRVLGVNKVMKWKYVKKLKSVKLINDFEKLTGYYFCGSFRNCVINYNGGRPSKKVFDTDKCKKRVLKSFLSFNKDDREAVWKIYDWSKEALNQKYIPFGIDNFGNLLCFNIANDHVIFINHEDTSIENVANDFDDFLNCLYE